MNKTTLNAKCRIEMNQWINVNSGCLRIEGKKFGEKNWNDYYFIRKTLANWANIEKWRNEWYVQYYSSLFFLFWIIVWCRLGWAGLWLWLNIRHTYSTERSMQWYSFSCMKLLGNVHIIIWLIKNYKRNASPTTDYITLP